MHRACTNNPLKSDRRNWMTGQENQCRRILCPCKKQLFHLTKSAVCSDCENRTMVWNHLEQSSKEGPDATENRLGGSWVSHVPWQSNVSKRVQVRPGDQPGYPKDIIESFVGHSSMGLLCPPANIVQNLEDTNQTINQTKGSFTSVQMVHTHTHAVPPVAPAVEEGSTPHLLSSSLIPTWFLKVFCGVLNALPPVPCQQQLRDLHKSTLVQLTPQHMNVSTWKMWHGCDMVTWQWMDLFALVGMKQINLQ